METTNVNASQYDEYYKKNHLSNMPGEYVNKDAIPNEIRYICRCRPNETRKSELVAYGAIGLDPNDPEMMIKQMQLTQHAYNIENNPGRYLIHECFGLVDDPSAEDVHLSNEELSHLARACAQDYYNLGYQVAYAVHRTPENKEHIHFIVSAMNYEDGHKYNLHYKFRNQRQYQMKHLYEKFRKKHIENTKKI